MGFPPAVPVEPLCTKPAPQVFADGTPETFDVIVTFCFTPEEEGLWPHHSSAPQASERFAAFCAMMIRRYAPECRATGLAAG
jgi:hypothetical protein